MPLGTSLNPFTPGNWFESLHPWEPLWIPSPLGTSLNPFTPGNLSESLHPWEPLWIPSPLWNSLNPFTPGNLSESLHPWEPLRILSPLGTALNPWEPLWIPSPLGTSPNPFTPGNLSESLHPWEPLWIPSPLGTSLNPFTLEKSSVDWRLSFNALNFFFNASVSASVRASWMDCTSSVVYDLHLMNHLSRRNYEVLLVVLLWAWAFVVDKHGLTGYLSRWNRFLDQTAPSYLFWLAGQKLLLILCWW